MTPRRTQIFLAALGVAAVVVAAAALRLLSANPEPAARAAATAQISVASPPTPANGGGLVAPFLRGLRGHMAPEPAAPAPAAPEAAPPQTAALEPAPSSPGETMTLLENPEAWRPGPPSAAPAPRAEAPLPPRRPGGIAKQEEEPAIPKPPMRPANLALDAEAAPPQPLETAAPPPVFANVPQPPTRPRPLAAPDSAALDSAAPPPEAPPSVASAAPEPVAAAPPRVFANVPAPPTKPRVLAALETPPPPAMIAPEAPTPPVASAPPPQEPAAAPAPVTANVPLPPTRPRALAALENAAPPTAREIVAAAPEPVLRPAPPEVFQQPERPARFNVGAPAFIRIFKKEGELELWLKTNGRYSLYRTFPICKWSGRLGPKTREADYQSPEGFYSVSARQLNPHSNYHLAFNVGYPNAFDRQNGHTGGLVMVHGNCKSVGCFAMTDKGIDEIYGFVAGALSAGQREVPVHIFPFRMTDAAIARETGGGGLMAFLAGENGDGAQWAGFWRNLKEGYDLFHQTGEPPTAYACGDHYAFGQAGSACRRVAGW